MPPQTSRPRATALLLALAGLLPGCGAPSAPATPPKPGKVLKSFVVLGSFEYQMDEEGRPAREGQIPPEVKAYDGGRADVPGFMMALDFEGGVTTRFLLMKDAGDCCFGGFAAINDWVLVTLPEGKGADIVRGAPIRVRGALSVGEGYAPEGFLHSIYQIAAEDVLEETPKGPGASVLKDLP